MYLSRGSRGRVLPLLGSRLCVLVETFQVFSDAGDFPPPRPRTEGLTSPFVFWSLRCLFVPPVETHPHPAPSPYLESGGVPGEDIKVSRGLSPAVL